VVTLIIIVVIGVVSRTRFGQLPWMAKEFGDVLWGDDVYLLILLVKPRIRVMSAAAIALAICFAIEFFKLVHAPWIDSLRARPMGYLLGHTFYWHDFLCYIIGVLLGVCCYGILNLHFKSTSASCNSGNRNSNPISRSRVETT